jgi:carbamoyl-phosphate synthase large subunit
VDLISDGKEVFIGGIMEHIEFAGVHSGDANIVVPSVNLYSKLKSRLEDYSRKIAISLNAVGLVNIQYAIKEDVVYVLEANPRASRTVPFISKAIGIPMAKIATKLLAGEKIDLKSLVAGYNGKFAVKGIVFPFLKLRGADIALGPEMKSTGETMGISDTFEVAYYKALLASGFSIPEQSGKSAALVSLRDEDKPSALQLERLLISLGFSVMATPGTAEYMANPIIVQKIHGVQSSGESSVMDVIGGGNISFIINTPKRGGTSQTDGFQIRRAAIERGIPCITNVRTAIELLKAMNEIKEKDIDVAPLGSL